MNIQQQQQNLTTSRTTKPAEPTPRPPACDVAAQVADAFEHALKHNDVSLFEAALDAVEAGAGRLDPLWGLVGRLAARLGVLERRCAAVEGHGIRFEGAHDAAKGYRRGSVVTHHGSSYVALSDAPSVPPAGHPEAWALIAQRGRDAR